MPLEITLTPQDIDVINGKLPELEPPVSYTVMDKSSTILGFLGHYLSLRLTSSDGKIKKLFVKTFPKRDLLDTSVIGLNRYFQREIDIYSIVFEDFRKYLNLEQLSWCPTFYFSKPKLIVLEDLDEQGYKMPQSKACLNFDQAMGVIKAMVDFHGSCLLFEEKTGWKIIDKYPSIAKEILYPHDASNPQSKKWIEKSIYELDAGVEYLDMYSIKEKEIIKRKLPKIIWATYTLNKPNERYRNVFIHGDLKTNNVMLSDSNEAKLVDYQFTGCAPPAKDLMYFIYLNFSKQLRDTFEDKLKENYYDLMQTKLNCNNLSGKNILSRDEFFASCEEYRHLALIQALLSLHYILAPKDEEHVQSKRDVAQYMQICFQYKPYRSRIIEIFVELIEKSEIFTFVKR